MVRWRKLWAVAALGLMMCTPAPAGEDGPDARRDLPPEPCVLALRTARITLETGGAAAGLARLREAATACGPLLETYLLVLELPEGASGALASEIGKIRAGAKAGGAGSPLGTLALAVRSPGTSREVLESIAGRLEKEVAGGRHDVTTLRALATAQARLGRDGPLEKTLRLLVKEAPDPWSRWALGRVAMRLGDWDTARKELALLAKTDDGLGFLARLALLEVYGAMGDTARAVELATELGKDTGGSVLVRERLVRTLLDAAWDAWDRDDAGTAWQLFQQALRLDPENREAQDALDLVLATPAEREAAQRRRMEHLVAGGNGQDLLEEGTKLLAAGDAAEAWTLLDRGTRAEPASAIGWYNLGLASQQLERWEDAARAYGRAAELAPHNAMASLGLGIALAKLGRCTEAVRALEAARSADGGLYQADYYLWSCYTKLGQAGPARQALERYNAARKRLGK